MDETADFTVLCYNVKCKGEQYDVNQREIARMILKESPDVVFLCEFNIYVSNELDSMMTQEGQYKRFYRSGSNCVFYSKYGIDSLSAINVGTSSGRSALNNKVYVYLPAGTITIVGCHMCSSRRNLVEGYRVRRSEADSI